MFDSAIFDPAIFDTVDYTGTRFLQVIAELEKHSVTTAWIDYEWIEPGWADWTPLDEVLARLEK